MRRALVAQSCEERSERDAVPVDQAATPLLGKIARRCEPVEQIRGYHMPGTQRRFWEELEHAVSGLVVIGDALASFNPVYGQGMTMAAYAATRLHGPSDDLRHDLPVCC